MIASREPQDRPTDPVGLTTAGALAEVAASLLDLRLVPRTKMHFSLVTRHLSLGIEALGVGRGTESAREVKVRLNRARDRV